MGMSDAHPTRGSEIDLHLAVRDALQAALLAWSGRSAQELGLEGHPELIAPGRPPRPEMGDLGISCFAFAKALRRAPAEIASALAGPVEAECARRSAAGEIRSRMDG